MPRTRQRPRNNECPKAERCKHAADCTNHDTFRGEYLCFDGRAINAYERERNKYQEDKGVKNDKNRKR